VRYKVWRCNKDKELHLICHEGINGYPPPLGTWDLGAGRRKAPLTSHAFRFACCSQDKRSCFCTATFRSSCWRLQGHRPSEPTLVCVRSRAGDVPDAIG